MPCGGIGHSVEHLVADNVEIRRKRHQIPFVIAALPIDHLDAVPESVEPLPVAWTLIGNYAVDAGIHWTALVIDIVTA